MHGLLVSLTLVFATVNQVNFFPMAILIASLINLLNSNTHGVNFAISMGILTSHPLHRINELVVPVIYFPAPAALTHTDSCRQPAAFPAGESSISLLTIRLCNLNHTYYLNNHSKNAVEKRERKKKKTTNPKLLENDTYACV